MSDPFPEPVRVITYSLRADGHDSTAYYCTIASFTDKWLEDAKNEVGDLPADFHAFRLQTGLPGRSEAEYAFELLVLGVLLREHGADAAGLPGWLANIQKVLLRLQGWGPGLEGLIKVWRGRLGWVEKKLEAGRKGYGDVSRLLTWLRANGNSSQADRLSQWQDYFDTLGHRAAWHKIIKSLALAETFAEASQRALGTYTERVEHFISEIAPTYRGRYDFELVSRTRLEYHLGMLGTEILNRVYRERFLAAGHKIVILPPCMRPQPEEKCKAKLTPFGAQCQACTPICRVHQITKLGEKLRTTSPEGGFDVFIIPDELRVFGSGAGGGDIGVIGVSCVLTNWSGGWDADGLGLPAQGLLLDYVGCAYHWDATGIPTDTNLNKLVEITSPHIAIGSNQA
jgi:hypothetical protein